MKANRRALTADEAAREAKNLILDFQRIDHQRAQVNKSPLFKLLNKMLWVDFNHLMLSKINSSERNFGLIKAPQVF